MHEELNAPNGSDGLNFENIIVGLRIECAVIGARLQIMGSNVLGAFQGYDVAVSFAALAGIAIPRGMTEHAFNK